LPVNLKNPKGASDAKPEVQGTKLHAKIVGGPIHALDKDLASYAVLLEERKRNAD